MKRLILPCILFIFGITFLIWPDASVLAQNAAKPYATRTPQSAPGPTRNAYEVLAAHKDLGKFVEMIDDADLKDMFSGSPDEPVTVFAPSDDAMGEIPHDMMKRIKANTASLQSFVKYHVITNSLVASSAIKGRKVSPASANGEVLMFDGTNKKSPLKVNDATLIQSDITATNGVIHIVSTALVPPSLKAEPVAPVAAPPKPAAPLPPVAPAVSPAAKVVSPLGFTASGSTPTQSTTTSAIPPAETTTGAVPEIPPETQTAPPSSQPGAAQPPSDDNSKGFSLFGHKFGW